MTVPSTFLIKIDCMVAFFSSVFLFFPQTLCWVIKQGDCIFQVFHFAHINPPDVLCKPVRKSFELAFADRQRKPTADVMMGLHFHWCENTQTHQLALVGRMIQTGMRWRITSRSFLSDIKVEVCQKWHLFFCVLVLFIQFNREQGASLKI